MDIRIRYLDFNMMVSWSNMYKIIIAVFIFLIFIDIVIKPKKALRWSFKGPVEKVWYDRKGIPFITVKGKEYDVFYFDWDFETKIEKGDTVIKQKGDLRLKLIRPNTRDTIYYNSNE